MEIMDIELPFVFRAVFVPANRPYVGAILYEVEVGATRDIGMYYICEVTKARVVAFRVVGRALTSRENPFQVPEMTPDDETGYDSKILYNADTRFIFHQIPGKSQWMRQRGGVLMKKVFLR
jgi:hypothetical protein